MEVLLLRVQPVRYTAPRVKTQLLPNVHHEFPRMQSPQTQDHVYATRNSMMQTMA